MISPPKLVYKAQGNEVKTKCTTTADSIDIQRVKWAQQLSNKVRTTNQIITVLQTKVLNVFLQPTSHYQET